jgi:oxygen-independent coproporphyrinogen-3 oxidase
MTASPSPKDPLDMSPSAFHSLYVHIPFCEAKCDYCAFYSIPDSSHELRQKYLLRLEEEFSLNSSHTRPLRSIFLGGGTPSSLSIAELTRLFELIRIYFTLLPDCEFSMEANPNSLTAEKLQTATEFGVNRISLGIQSFNPKIRKVLGRKGTLENLQNIHQLIKQNAKLQLNLDLIFNVPGQTLQEWEEDLKHACNMTPDHLSAYSLIFEEDTPLTQRITTTADDEEFCTFWKTTDQILNAHGLFRYEISNFAKPEKFCRHNFEIWHGQTCLGCGPVAVSFNGINRPANPHTLEDWLNHAPQIDDILPPEKRAAEILAFGLRTTAGWNCKEFEALTGFSPWLLKGDELHQLHQLEMLEMDQENIRPTEKGLLLNDDILEALI